MATYKDILELIDSKVKTIEALSSLKDNDIKMLRTKLQQSENLYWNTNNERCKLKEALDYACNLLELLGHKPAEEITWKQHFYKLVGLDTYWLDKEEE